MTSYEGLSARIDEIAEKAIDWRMEIMQWGKQGDGWIISGLASFWECDREGHVRLNGESQPDAYYVDMMRSWRTNLRKVLEPWTELPDPSTLDSRIDTLRAQMNSLLDPAQADVADADPTDSGVPALGNSDLHSARATVEAKIGTMRGYTAAEMYEVLVTRMDDVMRGEFAATGVLGVHLTGQKRILENARADVVKLVDSLYNVMAARGLVGSDAVDLAVVGSLVGLVGAFSTGGLATALGAVGAAVGLGEALMGEAEEADKVEASLAGYDPDQCWSLMVEALDRLNASITDQERDLSDAATRARYTVAGSADFDLSKVTGTGSDPGGLAGGDVMDIDKGGLRYIAEQSLVTASHQLDMTRYAIEDVDPSFAITRPASIGYASDGIYASWSGFQAATTRAIKGTSNELWELRAAVVDVLNRFGVTDVEQAERYREVEQLVPVGGRVFDRFL